MMKLKVSNVCQLFNKAKYTTETISGITWTNNNDGTITANGTATAESNYTLQTLNLSLGRKYLICGCPSNVEHSSYLFWGYCIESLDQGNFTEYGSGVIMSTKDLGYGNSFGYYMTYRKGQTATNQIWKPQLFDLTEMYGAGHEPTTVEQFRQDFPNEMYDYSPECWKRLKELRYRTETKNLLDYSKFNPVWKNDGVIKSSGYISKPTSAYNSSLFYNVVGFSVDLPDVSNLLLLQGTYTFSVSSISKDFIYIIKYNADGTQNSPLETLSNVTKSCTLTFSEPTYVDLKVESNSAVVITGLMVQEGSTSTPYQPYGYLPLRRGEFIVNKEPVQLFNKATYPVTQTNKGVTFTNNGDGTITVNGTATDSGNAFSLQVVTLHKDHLYFIYADQSGSFANIVFTVDALGSASNVEGNFWKSSVEGEKQAYFWVTSGITISNRVYKPQFFDLTAMYGAGSEPTTVEQFRADYPNDLYEYNLLNAVSFH